MKDSDFVVADLVARTLTALCEHQRDGKLEGKSHFCKCAIYGFTDEQKEQAMLAIERCGFICSYDQCRITISLSN